MINISEQDTIAPPRGALGQELKEGDTILFHTLRYGEPRIAIIHHIEIYDRSVRGLPNEVLSIEVLVINPISSHYDYNMGKTIVYKNGYRRKIWNWRSALTLDSQGMIVQNEPFEMDLRGKEETR